MGVFLNRVLLRFLLHFHAGHRRIDEGYEVTENIGHFRQQSSIDAASRSEVTTASGDLGSQMLFDESRHALQGASRGASAGSLTSLPLLGLPGSCAGALPLLKHPRAGRRPTSLRLQGLGRSPASLGAAMG